MSVLSHTLQTYTKETSPLRAQGSGLGATAAICFCRILFQPQKPRLRLHLARRKLQKKNLLKIYTGNSQVAHIQIWPKFSIKQTLELSFRHPYSTERLLCLQTGITLDHHELSSCQSTSSRADTSSRGRPLFPYKILLCFPHKNSQSCPLY